MIRGHDGEHSIRIFRRDDKGRGAIAGAVLRETGSSRISRGVMPARLHLVAQQKAVIVMRKQRRRAEPVIGAAGAAWPQQALARRRRSAE